MAKDGVALLTRQRHATHAQAVGKRRPRKPVLYITHICVSIHMYIYIHECTDRYIIFAYIYMWLVCRPPVRVWRGADCTYISISTYVYRCVYIHTYIHTHISRTGSRQTPAAEACRCFCRAGPYVCVYMCVSAYLPLRGRSVCACVYMCVSAYLPLRGRSAALSFFFYSHIYELFFLCIPAVAGQVRRPERSEEPQQPRRPSRRKLAARTLKEVLQNAPHLYIEI